ncbi:tubulin FtsZ domain containing protein, partial [Striga asiatica]
MKSGSGSAGKEWGSGFTSGGESAAMNLVRRSSTEKSDSKSGYLGRFLRLEKDVIGSGSCAKEIEKGNGKDEISMEKGSIQKGENFKEIEFDLEDFKEKCEKTRAWSEMRDCKDAVEDAFGEEGSREMVFDGWVPWF